MSVDDDFYKRLRKLLEDLMTPEGQRKIMEFFQQNQDYLKGIPFFTNMNINEIQKFFENINKNPNIKISFSAIPQFGFPFFDNFSRMNKSTAESSNHTEIPEPECFWLDDEYHIIIYYPEDVLKFKTAVHKKDKNKILLIILNEEGKIIKKIRLPPNIYYKKHSKSWNNGVYEIIYKKVE